MKKFLVLTLIVFLSAFSVEIVIDVPVQYAERIKEAFQHHFRHNPEIDLSTNQLLLKEIKKFLINDLKKFVRNYEYMKARQKAVEKIEIEEIILGE